jgi:hypothetical protein
MQQPTLRNLRGELVSCQHAEQQLLWATNDSKPWHVASTKPQYFFYLVNDKRWRRLLAGWWTWNEGMVELALRLCTVAKEA